MGKYTFGICRDKALELKEKHGLVDFVETGTLVGHTSQWAAAYFRNVTTVDNLPDVRADENLKGLANVHQVIMDSVEYLEQLKVWAPTLFWLDAHTNEFCPVLREIAAINKLDNCHVILVDDVNQFGPLPAWPSKAEAIAALQNGGKRTVYEFQDVFVAEPCP